jgi:hypothetical protein
MPLAKAKRRKQGGIAGSQELTNPPTFTPRADTVLRCETPEGINWVRAVLGMVGVCVCTYIVAVEVLVTTPGMVGGTGPVTTIRWERESGEPTVFFMRSGNAILGGKYADQEFAEEAVFLNFAIQQMVLCVRHFDTSLHPASSITRVRLSFANAHARWYRDFVTAYNSVLSGLSMLPAPHRQVLPACTSSSSAARRGDAGRPPPPRSRGRGTPAPLPAPHHRQVLLANVTCFN